MEQQASACKFLFVLRLNISPENISMCMVEFFWGKKNPPEAKNIKLLWCQKAQRNSKMLEKVIKVDQFKLAELADK